MLGIVCARWKDRPIKLSQNYFVATLHFFFFSFSNSILLAVSSNSTSANRNLIISSTSLRSANDTHVNDFPSCRTPLCRPQKLLYRQSGERRNSNMLTSLARFSRVSNLCTQRAQWRNTRSPSPTAFGFFRPWKSNLLRLESLSFLTYWPS